jgi:hypothetical protein
VALAMIAFELVTVAWIRWRVAPGGARPARWRPVAPGQVAAR